jgi:hypothetical protein
MSELIGQSHLPSGHAQNAVMTGSNPVMTVYMERAPNAIAPHEAWACQHHDLMVKSSLLLSFKKEAKNFFGIRRVAPPCLGSGDQPTDHPTHGTKLRVLVSSG